MNRTLGSILEVCPRLLDAALKDPTATSSILPIQAGSTLHGLSEWVLKQNSNKDEEEKVKAMARGELKEGRL